MEQVETKVDVLAVVDATIKLAQEGYIPEHHEVVALEQARAAIAELIERERKLLAYIAAIKVQATEAPACDADRLRLVVMYCDDAIASAGGAK